MKWEFLTHLKNTYKAKCLFVTCVLKEFRLNI
nr:MAG TPA: hypothetical protein [Caudoviricetes sp.]